jgi:hypothetical protein
LPKLAARAVSSRKNAGATAVAARSFPAVWRKDRRETPPVPRAAGPGQAWFEVRVRVFMMRSRESRVAGSFMRQERIKE